MEAGTGSSDVRGVWAAIVCTIASSYQQICLRRRLGNSRVRACHREQARGLHERRAPARLHSLQRMRRRMTRNPILDLPLTAVIRAEIALPLGQLLSICTVGSL